MRILTHAVRKAMMAASVEQQEAQKRASIINEQELTHEQEPGQDQTSNPITIPCQPIIDHQLLPRHSKRIKPNHQQKNQIDDDRIFDFITKENLPNKMEKYWAQRKRLFSRFDEGIRLDIESWYSVTPELIAKQIAARCRCKVIVDGFCGAGGNSIQFAMTCDKVIAIDKDPNKIKLAKHNSKIYGVSNKIEFICADFIEWIQDLNPGSVDVVFLSPPWGGVEYLTKQEGEESPESQEEEEEEESEFYYKLKDLKPINGKELYDLAKRVTDQIVYYLPRHMDLMDLGQLEPLSLSQNPLTKTIEVEENWMNRKCKALTAYFGPLISPTSSSC